MINKSENMHYALLDRDGTIIVDKVYLSKPEDIEFSEGAIEGMRLLHEAGFGLVLITNQSGVARGYFDIGQLEKIHFRLKEMLQQEDITLAAIYYCPHAPDDNCDCRKPQPGMIINFCRDFSSTIQNLVLIGDSETDMCAAKAANIKGVRISQEIQLDKYDFPVVSDFLSAAKKAISLFEKA